MADALWINEQDLIDNSVIIDSVDFKVITPNIIYAQDAYLTHLLGTRLFNEINGQIITNYTTPGSITALNLTLLNNYIKKIIVNYVLAESAPDMVYRWTNKGIMTKNADNSSAITPEQLAFTVERFKNRAESYANRLRLYLIQEQVSYPLYNANTDLSDIQPDRKSYTTGIFLDGYEGCRMRGGPDSTIDL